MKRKYQDDGGKGSLSKRLHIGNDYDRAFSRETTATAHTVDQTSSRLKEPVGTFSMFELLPTEIQFHVFEQALADIDKPRICLLDVATIPCFGQSHFDRGLTMGWSLSVHNRTRIHSENPFRLARSLLDTCPSGAYVAERFLQSHVVWDPPHYCAELKTLDLSLSSDVFWLPDDLYEFFALRSIPAACAETGRDECRIRRLMISLSTFEKVLCWHDGHVQDDEVRGSEASRTDLQMVLERTFWSYPGCTELVVLVDADRGSSERPHLSWDKLRYIPPTTADQYPGPKHEWNIDQDIDLRCCAIWDQYHELLLDEELMGPDLSFAFV